MVTHPGTAPPRRVSGAGYWIGALVLTIGIGAGTALLLSAAFSLIDEVVNRAPKVGVGGAGPIELTTTGCQDLYYFSTTDSVSFSSPTVSITAPDGSEVPIAATPCVTSAGTADQPQFRVIGSVRVSAVGTYQMKVDRPTGVAASDQNVAVARPLEELTAGVASQLLAGLAVGAVGCFAGLALIIVTSVRRGRARRRAFGPPRPLSPYPGPYGPAPAPGWLDRPAGYGPPADPRHAAPEAPVEEPGVGRPEDGPGERPGEPPGESAT